jgi:hypothetical protein
MLKYSIGMIYLKTCPTRRARLIMALLVSVFVPRKRKNEESDEDASTKLKYKFSGGACCYLKQVQKHPDPL